MPGAFHIEGYRWWRNVLTGAFTVTWGAVDAQAGVAWYDLDVSVDGGPWQRVLTHTTSTNYHLPIY